VKVSAIVQARMGSTRLPGKVLRDLAGRPLVEWICERVGQAQLVDEVVLATTQEAEDDQLADWAKSAGLHVFRGSSDDVLDRYYNAAKQVAADVIVRITADDPFKDPIIIDQVIHAYLKAGVDFAYNNFPPTFPEGLDVEVFAFQALQKSTLYALSADDREHVTQYLYRNPNKFSQLNIPYTKNISWLRWTIDTEDDFEMASAVYKHFQNQTDTFLMNDILEFLRSNPEVVQINQDVKRSSMYDDIDVVEARRLGF